MQKRKKEKWRRGSQMRIGMDLGMDESLTEWIGEGEERMEDKPGMDSVLERS